MPLIGPGDKPYRKSKKRKKREAANTGGRTWADAKAPKAPPRFPSPVAAPPIPVAPPPMRSTPQEATYGLNLKNLSQAYFEKYQTFPNAVQTYFMLNNANGELWSPDEWRKLLAPGKAAPSPLFLEFSKLGAGRRDPLARRKKVKWAEDDLRSLGPKATPKDADWVRQLANRPMHTLGKTWGGKGANRINNDDIKMINDARIWYGGTQLKIRINENIAEREEEEALREDAANEPDTVVKHEEAQSQFRYDPRMGNAPRFTQQGRTLAQRAAEATGTIVMGLPGEDQVGGVGGRSGGGRGGRRADGGDFAFAISEQDNPWLRQVELPDFAAVPRHLSELRDRTRIDIEHLSLSERDAYVSKAHNMVEWKRYWAGVMEENGEKVPFDPDNLDWTPAAQKQYHRYLWMRLLPYAVQSKDAQVRDQALTAMQSVYPELLGTAYTDPRGKTALKPIDMLANLNEVLQSIPDQEDQKAYLFSAFKMGRDPGDSDVKVRNDYVSQFGQSALPSEEVANYREHLLTVNKIMAWPFEKLTEGMRYFGEATDFGFEALGRQNGTLGMIGDGLERAYNAGILETNPFTSQAAPWAISKAHQAGTMFIDVLHDWAYLAATTPEEREAIAKDPEKYIGKDIHGGDLSWWEIGVRGDVPETTEGDFWVPGGIPLWHEWVKKWDEAAGQDAFVHLGEGFSDERGWSDDDWRRQGTRDLMTVVSLVAMLKAGKLADTYFIRPGVAKAARGAFDAARRLDDRARGPGKEAGFIGEDGIGPDFVQGKPAKPTEDVWNANLDDLPEEARTRYGELRAEYEGLSEELMRDAGRPERAAAGDAANVVSPSDVRARIREHGGINLDAEGTKAFIDGTFRGSERSGEFRGLGRRGKGLGLDELAASLKEEWPGLPFDDAESLLEYIRSDAGGQGAGRGLPASDVRAKMARLDELENDAADLIAGRRIPERQTAPKVEEPDWMRDEGTIDAPDPLFDRSEFIGEGQQSGLDIAIDDAARKTEPVARMPERSPEEMPGQTAMGETPPKAGEPATAPDGVKVRDVETPEGPVTVDASVAPAVQRLNDAGYKTHQSHGVKSDHPAGHPARKAGPYVEFAVRDLGDAATRGQKISAIRAAAKETGSEIVDGKATIDGAEHSTIIVRTPDVDAFTDALLGDRGAVPPEGAPPVRQGFSDGLPPTHPDYLHLKVLMTVSEYIAAVLEVGDAAVISRMLNIPDPAVLPVELRSVVKRNVHRMQQTKDPDIVLAAIDEIVDAGVDTIDPMGPSFFRAQKVRAYENAVAAADMLGPLGRPLADITSTFLTPIHMNREVPFRDADRHVRNIGMSVRMGRRRMTKDDMDELRVFEQRIWETDDPIARNRVLEDFQQAVLRNMKEEGTLDSYRKFEKDILSARAKWVKTTFPNVKMEAYGKNSSVTPTLGRLYAEIADYRKKAAEAEAAGKADVAAVWTAQADGVEGLLKRQQDAGRIYTDAQKHPEKYRMKGDDGRDLVTASGEYVMNESYRDAVADLRALGTEQPVWMYQMKKSLTVDEFDPRFLAWHQSGRAAAKFMKYDTLFADPLVRMWKRWTLAGLGFPLRVYAGDEFWRLPMEGIGPTEYAAARAAVKEMRGDITRAERKRLTELNGKKELTEPEAAELARIEEKARPKVPDDVLELIKNNPDFVDADFGGLYQDYWQILSPISETLADGTVKVRLPDDPRYLPKVRSDMGRFAEEPAIQRLLKRDDWTREEALQEIRNWMLEDSESGAALRTYLVETKRITLPMSDLKTGALKRVLIMPSSGSARHLANVMDDWVDMYINMQRSPEMLDALRKGHIDLPTLQRIGETNPAALPPVPVGHFDTLTRYPWLRRADLLSLAYERITLPLLQTLGGRVKDALFGHEYLKQRDAILAKNPGMDPAVVMEQAAGRAAHYVERTTYTRNATVFEDMARNHILFINSYRQFWQYWMTKMVTNPATMATLWNVAPEREDPGIMGFFAKNFSSFMPFFLQAKDFEESREKTPGAMMKGILQPPGPGPIASPFLGYFIRKTFDTDPSELPFGASMGEGMQPLQRLGTLSKGLFNITLPLSTDNTNSQAIMRAWEKETVDIEEYNTPGTGVGRQQLQSHLPFPYSAMTWVRDKVNENGPEWIKDHIFGDQVASLEMVRALTGTPSFLIVPKPPIYTKYREEAAKYFELMKEGQPLRAATYLEGTERYQYVKQYNETTDPEERSALLEENPWIAPLARSNFIYEDEGVLLFDDDVKREENPKAMWNFRELLRKQYGGFETDPDTGEVKDNTENFYVGDILRADQWPKVQKHLNDIRKLAEDAARELATKDGTFNKKRYDMHIYQWEKRTSHDLKLGKWVERPDAPAWYDRYVERHKGKLSRNLPEGWDVHSYWHPGEYEKVAVGFYKSDFVGGPFEPSEDQMQLALRMIENGLVPDHIAAKWMAKGTASGAVARKVDREAIDGYRSQVIDIISDEFYDLDQKVLNHIGYDFGPEVDKAIEKIQDMYYARMGNPKWVDAMGGTSTREYRDERNRFHAYKDKVFRSIKGGEAFIGGTAERILHTPFLVGTESMDFPGPGSRNNTALWLTYLKEARKDTPNLKLVKRMRDALTDELPGRLGSQQAAVDWVAVAAVAKTMRNQMKTSYSEYYEGPGNSVYSNAGKAMVAKLEQYIVSLAKKKNERTTFGRDLRRYGWDAHSLAFDMLEWYWN